MNEAPVEQRPKTLPAAYDSKVEGNVIFTRLDAAMNWMRANSLWPIPMGMAVIWTIASGIEYFWNAWTLLNDSWAPRTVREKVPPTKSSVK